MPASLLSCAHSTSKGDIQWVPTGSAGLFALLDWTVRFKNQGNNRNWFDSLFTHTLLCTPHCAKENIKGSLSSLMLKAS